MTQCKEIAKKLKKMLSIYSIEEKESELLPEFTEPCFFDEKIFEKIRNGGGVFMFFCSSTMSECCG